MLVVEHERSASRAVWAPLTAAGFEVIVAATADDACSSIERWPPSAVVIDAAMPLEESRALFRHARRWGRQHDPDLPVLLVRMKPASSCRTARRASLRRRALVDLLQAALSEPEEPLRRVAAR